MRQVRLHRVKSTDNRLQFIQQILTVLGEDNILTVLEKQNYKIKCEIIANMFKNRMQEYYQKGDLEKGYFEGKNKHGEKKKYPLINICSERVV